jgi:hypothetical protein
VQRSIVVGSVLAALGLLVWLAWTMLPAGGDEVAAAPVAVVPPETEERPPAEVARPGVEEGGPQVLVEAAPPVESRSTAEAAPGGEALELAVVDAAGAAVPSAEVWVLSDAGPGDVNVFGRLDQVDALMTERGVRREADTAGRLKISAPSQAPTLVLASRGRLWGTEQIDPDDEGPIQVELELDATLRARVIDSRDRPLAGVEIELVQKTEHWSNSMRTAETLGAEGVATFRHAQRTVRERGGGSWYMGVSAMLETPVEAALEPGALPTEVVTLALPAVGAVEVRVFDDDWSEFAGEATAALGIVREGEPRHISPFSEIRRPRVEHKVVNGVATFPHVALGHELEVLVRRGGSRVPTYAYGRGPAVAGEQRSLDVRLGADHPVALLRAVDAEGRPMADTALQVRVELNAQHIRSADDANVTTDASGRFKVDLDNDWAEGTDRVMIVTLGPREAPDATGEVDAGQRLEPGINDLGDVVLGAAPLFAAGQVISAAGEGIGGARLRLRTKNPGRSWWNDEWSFDHVADGTGHFEVHGSFPGNAFRLGASKDGWAGEWLDFEPGASTLVIQMSAAGAVVGSVLLDEDLPTDLMRLRLMSSKPGANHLDNHTTELAEDGTFAFDELPAGEFRFTLSFDGLRGELVSIEGVLVRAGETNRDARLELIDLRGKLFAHHLTLVTDDEDTPVQGQIHYGPPNAEELQNSRWFNEREVDLVSEHELLDVKVSARGYRTADLEDVSGDIEVRLEGGMRVRLRLVGDIQLPEPPIFIKAVLSPVDGSHRTMDWGAEPFDERRESIVRVPSAGEMKVRWILERRSSGSSIATSANVEPEQTVEVLDVPDQTIEVSLTPEQLQQVLKALE